MNGENNLVILMAEDDDGHARLVQDRFAEVGVCNKVIRFRDGVEAWAFLSDPARGPEPGGSYLLLLDIRMPRMDGVEVLERVKADARLRNMPVVMLTTTDDPGEINRCYELGCSSYLVKPVEFEKFTEVIKRLGLFLLVIKVGSIKPE